MLIIYRYHFEDLLDTDTYDDCIIIKFMDTEYTKSFMSGSMYFSLAKTFHDGLKDDPCYDPTEGKLVIAKKLTTFDYKPHLNYNKKTTIEVYLRYALDIISADTIPIYCTSHATRNSLSDLILKSSVSHSNTYTLSYSFIHDLMLDEHNICKGRPFAIFSLKDLINKFKAIKVGSDFKNSYDLQVEKVIYLDYNNTINGFMSNISFSERMSNKYVSLFRKSQKYKKQHEFRFILTDKNTKGKPKDVPLKLAPLHDITQIYSEDTKLEDFTFTYDIKDRKFTVNPPKETK